MRSRWKIPYISPNFFQNKFLSQKEFKTIVRYSLIPSTFINKRVYVYNGRHYKSKDITLDMLSHKFGEFSTTKVSDSQMRLKRKTKKRSNKHKK